MTDSLDFQNLLGPTWKDRARADDALRWEILECAADELVWPESIQGKISRLRPSPEIFLSALVGFWSYVSLRDFNKTMNKQIDQRSRDMLSRTSSRYSHLFPIEPVEPPPSASVIRGMCVWELMSKLGPYASAIEEQLLACLDHPSSIVWDSAESALGTIDHIGDQAFTEFLAYADRVGTNGQIWKRSRIAARHTCGRRVHELLSGMKPDAQESLNISRLHIMKFLKGEAGRISHDYLCSHINEPLLPEQLALALRALAALGIENGFRSEIVEKARMLVNDPDSLVQSSAVVFLAANSLKEHCDVLLGLLSPEKPWILTELCQVLEASKEVPVSLLRATVAHSLGNYDDDDGYPHSSAVRVLSQSSTNARNSIDEIVQWWNKTKDEDYIERSAIEDALDIADILNADAVGLLPGLRKALNSLMVEGAVEEDLSLDQEDAIPKIESKLSDSMIAGGLPAEQASLVASAYGTFLEQLKDNFSAVQSRIDAQNAEFESEQRDLYPERFIDDHLEVPEEENFEEVEDELLVRLRIKIEQLSGDSVKSNW